MPASPLESLMLVPVADLVLHEAVESARAEAVLTGVRRSGVLTDPVVAAAGPDGRWLVLDGAHRTAALASLGVPVAVVQQMELFGWSEPGFEPAGPSPLPPVRLDGWAHDIRGIDLDEVLPPGADRAADQELPGDREKPGDPAGAGGRALIATVSSPGRTFRVLAEDGVQDRLDAMWALAGRYAGHGYVRSHPDDPATPGTSVRVSWAPIRPVDLVALAATGQAFPPGVSRFVVRGRLLGVRVPLAELRRAAPGGRPDADAARQLLHRLRELPVRHYRDPVWVVETSQPDFGTDGSDPHHDSTPDGKGRAEIASVT